MSLYPTDRTRRALRLLTPPSVEPISLDRAKLHLRVDINDDDDYIRTLISVARQYVETVTRRALISQQWRLTLDVFPGWAWSQDVFLWPFRDGIIEIEKPPIRSIDSITYIDPNNATIVLDPTTYTVDLQQSTARIEPVVGAYWPLTQFRIASVAINFTSGYTDGRAAPADPPIDGDPANLIPSPIKAAMLLLIGSLYENREGVSGVQSLANLPFGIEELLSPFRAWAF